ncbi:MAG: 5'-nucleotidase/apyrase family protein [Proteobacteria bacterium]|nr:5'-nucleotidase/apyrase family protein [Pseudomonadota bacterium]
MMTFPRPFRPIFCLALALLLLAACARPARQSGSAPFTLAIAHINDTHSNLEPVDTGLSLAGVEVKARLGGYARLKTALDEVRGSEASVLALHAGDAVQGTLFFNEFKGRADFDILNLLGLDAMALGNHEFDSGPELTGKLVEQARFPVVSANIDTSREPALAGRIRPYVVRLFGSERVGVIGAITPSTPQITTRVGQVVFHPAAPAVAVAIAELRAQDVDKIVVLSHLGYGADIALAKAVPGIDVIVGGHSHTLLGDAARLGQLGLTPAGPYPTEVRGPDGGRVLVVQAWRWGVELGVLKLTFDAEGGIAEYTARPMLLAGDDFSRDGKAVAKDSPEQARLVAALTASGVARVVAEDAGVAARIAPYARRLDAFRNAPIGARAVVDLIRGTATDPGPIVADAYLAKAPGAQLALLMPGGLRQDLYQGELTLGMVMGVLPFGNTLVTLNVSGAGFKSALEEAAEFRLKVHPPAGRDLRNIRLFHAGGFTCVVDPARPRGERVSQLLVRGPGGDFAAIDPAATYRLVTNSYLAGGGDGQATLKAVTSGRVDTGYLEHDALAEHLKALGVVQAPARRRVVLGRGGRLSLAPVVTPGALPASGPLAWSSAGFFRFDPVRQDGLAPGRCKDAIKIQSSVLPIH